MQRLGAPRLPKEFSGLFWRQPNALGRATLRQLDSDIFENHLSVFCKARLQLLA